MEKFRDIPTTNHEKAAAGFNEITQLLNEKPIASKPKVNKYSLK